MKEYPHVPAAFINAIAEEGTKTEAVEYLQKQWNENCALRSLLRDCCDAAANGQPASRAFIRARAALGQQQNDV